LDESNLEALSTSKVAKVGGLFFWPLEFGLFPIDAQLIFHVKGTILSFMHYHFIVLF